MTEERLREVEDGAADLNLKMWDHARGTISELCAEVRRLQMRELQWRDKWQAAVDTAESWMSKAFVAVQETVRLKVALAHKENALEAAQQTKGRK